MVMKLWCLLLCLFTSALHGHNMPGSTVALDFSSDHVDASLTLPLQELELSFKQPLLEHPDQVLARHEQALRAYLLEHIQPVAPDGREWRVEIRAIRVQLTQTPYDLLAEVRMTPPAGASSRQFRFNYSVINHEVMSHIAMVMVRNDWDHSVFSGAPETLGMLQFTVTSLEVDRRGGGWWNGFRSVFHLGMSHIAEGTDHLLFLLVLLLPASLVPVNGRWAMPQGIRPTLLQLLRVISAFTLGHSLTLAISAMGWCVLPQKPVEILIAASVLVSAIHAMRPIFPGRESWIALGFGLIHGLAFASSLAEKGFYGGYLLLSLVSFNLGIEVMQMMILAVVLPWLILVSRVKVYTVWRLAGAGFAGIAALLWIIQRAIDWQNPLDEKLMQMTHAPWACLVGLVILAVLSFRMGKKWSGVIPSKEKAVA
jgi:HupE / UreJ protein